MADRLGEQLLTEVKAFLKITLRFAKAFMLGVLQTMLLYTCVSKPASSPIMTKTFFLLFKLAFVKLQAIKIMKITTSSCPAILIVVLLWWIQAPKRTSSGRLVVDGQSGSWLRVQQEQVTK